MGNYLYDDYEAKMKVTNDIINDHNFYTKLKENYVSPKKIFTFVQIIFATFKCPPYHTKFLQIFYNNLNILERDEYFNIVEELNKDLTVNKLSFHESYNNFNGKLCDIKAKNPDRSIFNYGLVKPKKDALEFFFLYVNYHRSEFENIKNKIKHIVKEVKTYPDQLETNRSIQKLVYDEILEDGRRIEETYIGNVVDGKKEGQGMLIQRDKSNGEIIVTFYGEFVNDKKNGYGLENGLGRQIEGTFVDNEADGKMGVYTETSKFYVEYRNGKRHGRYIELKNDGSIYTKEFKDGKLTDHFQIYTKYGDLIICKKLSEDEYKGVFYYASEGRVDVGIFNRQLKLNGEGYRYYNNNDSIYCKFEDGNIIPSICYLCKAGGEISFGYCNENANLHGKDILTFFYTDDEYKGDLMINDYVNGEQNGNHEYYWGDGDYEKRLANGWGIRAYKDKERVMEGTFMDNGFPKGPGYFSYKGTKYEGVYDLNEERCLFISNNRRAYVTHISHEARFNEAEAKQYKAEVNN